MGDSSPVGPITISLPADPSLVRLARLVASGVGTAAGFDVEEVDDLRIAVAEACVALIEGGDGSAVSLAFVIDGPEVQVTGVSPAGNGAVSVDGERSALGDQILAAAVDVYSRRDGAGRIEISLQKRCRADGPDG